MYKLAFLFLVFHVVMAKGVQSLTLDWKLAKCLVSKPALFLTYLSSLTGCRNFAVIFCVKRLQAFQTKRLFGPGSKAVTFTTYLCPGESLYAPS